MKRKPVILAVTNEGPAMREVRVVMPFSVLKEQGHILDYAVTDTTLEGVPEDFKFDVLWLQRVKDLRFLEDVSRFFGDRFVYDLDDLLLARPSYVKHRVKNTAAVAYALRQCERLTVTSERAAALLEQYSGLVLSHKISVCPNGSRFPASPKPPSKPRGILWSSSDYAALTTSRREVFEALTEFAGRHDLPLHCFGYMEDVVKERFPRVIDYGFVSFWHHKLILANHRALIGVAPLETRADGETQDFINAKSDLKLIDFVGFGHPCVCSSATPYVDTDLRVGTKVENTFEAWLEGLEQTYASRWMDIKSEQELVVGSRDMTVLGPKTWLGAIAETRLAAPVSVKQFERSRPYSLRRTAHRVLSSSLRAFPLLRRVHSWVPGRFRSEVKRLLIE
jgi:hypothetical protein